jgi:hypothetical protein
MKLYIPDISDVIKLTKDWTFSMSIESRNEEFLKNTMEFWKPRDDAEYRWLGDWIKNEFYFENDESYNNQFYTITIPKDTILSIDRIYIRKGIADYSSVTFLIKESSLIKGKKKGGKRFWAKLRDVNEIEFEHLDALNVTVQWPDSWEANWWDTDTIIYGKNNGINRFEVTTRKIKRERTKNEFQKHLIDYQMTEQDYLKYYLKDSLYYVEENIHTLKDLKTGEILKESINSNVIKAFAKKHIEKEIIK